MNIAIIGCGVMGSSLARNIANVKRMILCSLHLSKISKLKEELGCEITDDAAFAYEHSDIVILGVKPNSLSSVSEKLLKVKAKKPKLLLSILAGVTLDNLKKAFPHDKCVRIMPNLPLIVKRGVIATSFPQEAKEEDIKQTKAILENLGMVAIVPEKLIDPITVLAGSGPGYLCLFLEAMVDAGVHMGLKSQDARKYALETLIGTGMLLQEKDLSLGELKHQVASPAGCTIEAIVSMEKSGVRSGIIQGILDAYKTLS